MPVDDILSPAPAPVSALGRYRVLSKLAGVRVSPLVLGGMSLGNAWSAQLSHGTDDAAAFKLLDAFYEAGGNFIDTANNYQDEESETVIGKWMAARNNRDSIVLSTKFTANFRVWKHGKTGKVVTHGGNSKKSMFVSVRESLRKLQTDYIDLLFVHFWDWSTSIPELMDSLHVLVTQGKVLYLGASDFPAWVVATANAYAIANNKTPFSVYQGPWNLLERGIEDEVIPLCRHYGMAIMPWSAMGGGKFKTEAEIEARKKSGKPIREFFGERTDQERQISAGLDKVGDAIKARTGSKPSVTAVALAWIMQKAPYVFPLVGGTSVDQLKQNIEALKIQLTSEEVKELESLAPIQPSLFRIMLSADPALTGSHTLTDAMAPMSYMTAPGAITPSE